MGICVRLGYNATECRTLLPQTKEHKKELVKSENRLSISTLRALRKRGLYLQYWMPKLPTMLIATKDCVKGSFACDRRSLLPDQQYYTLRSSISGAAQLGNLAQPHYSPNLALAESFLFPTIKTTLRSHHFEGNVAIRTSLMTALKVVSVEAFHGAEPCPRNLLISKHWWSQNISNCILNTCSFTTRLARHHEHTMYQVCSEIYNSAQRWLPSFQSKETEHTVH